MFEKDLEGEQILSEDIYPWLLVCPFNCRDELEKALMNAKKSISIQAQYVQDDRLVDLLLKRQNDLDLRILVGKWQNDWWVEKFDTWVVRIVKSPYIHAKNMLIDESSLMIGSMNFSTNALDNNREIGIVTSDMRAVKTFMRQFEKDWEVWVEERSWEYEER